MISAFHYYSILLKWLIEGFETIPPQFAEHILPIAIAGFDIKSNNEYASVAVLGIPYY